MKFKKESLNLLYFVWSNIKNKRKKQLLFILPIIFIGSLSESFTIAAVVPFLLNIINKNSINIQNNSFSFISEILPENTNNLFLLLVLIIIFSLTFRMLSIYSYNKWTALVGSIYLIKRFHISQTLSTQVLNKLKKLILLIFFIHQ